MVEGLTFEGTGEDADGIKDEAGTDFYEVRVETHFELFLTGFFRVFGLREKRSERGLE